MNLLNTPEKLKLLELIPSQKSHLWSLADQALVSGSNFLTGIVLARFLGLEAFGAYVIAQMYLLYANTFQASLVVSPMMTAVPAQQDWHEQTRMIQGFMGYALLVTLVTVLGVQVIAWGLGTLSVNIGVGDLALPLAAAMAAFQLQDWLRRALYVRLNNRLVFISDALAYGGHLTLLFWLGVAGELSAGGALSVMAASFSVAGLFTMAVTRVWPSRAAAQSLIAIHAHASRDFLATWQLQWLGSQGVILLGSAMVGQHAAGAIRAAQNLLGPVNVLFQWLDNVMPVRAALRLRDHGRAALVAWLGRFAWLGLVALSLFVLGLAWVDEALMALLYGEEYRPYAFLVVLMGLYYLFGYGYRMPSYFHRALGNTRVLAHASLWWVIAAFVIALISIRWIEEKGILLALVVGQVVALVYLLAPHRALSGKHAAEWAGHAERRYLVLRRGDGSPHLLLPNANNKVLYEALRMYYPSRWLGRLYRLSLARTLPWRARLGWVEAADSLAEWCPPPAPILASLPGLDERFVGVLIGTPGPCSKWTLKFMDDQGGALAYARVARQPLAVARLHGELAVLSALADMPVARQVPAILAHGALPDSGELYLVESAGPEGATPHLLAEMHFKFLASLLGQGRQSWSHVIDRMVADLEQLHGEPVLSALVEKALSALRAAPVGSLPVCIEHGDFAPWNIRDNGEVGIFVLDWEHARLHGLPWLDALHFVYQNGALVRRLSPEAVLVSLRSIFLQPGAQAYAYKIRLAAGQEWMLIALYLLRMLAVGGSEGLDAGSHQQDTRRRVLSLLLEQRS